MAVQRKNTTVTRKRYASSWLYFVLIVMGLVVFAFGAQKWLTDTRHVEIEVSGQKITTKEDIAKLANIPDTMSIANVDMIRVKHNVERNPFVRAAIVTKIPPYTIKIEVFERTSYAKLIEPSNKEWLLDRDGVVMPCTKKDNENLPVITGVSVKTVVEKGQRIARNDIWNALEILTAAEEYDPTLLARISEVHINGGRDILLYCTDGGMPVIFGKSNGVKDKIAALGTLLAQKTIQEGYSTIQYIDLRFHDQVVVQYNKDV